MPWAVVGAKPRVDNLARNQPHDEFSMASGIVTLDFLVHRAQEIVQDQPIFLTNPFDQPRIGDRSGERIAQCPFVIAISRATPRALRGDLEHSYGFAATAIARFNSTSRESVGRYPDLTSRTFWSGPITTRAGTVQTCAWQTPYDFPTAW